MDGEVGVPVGDGLFHLLGGVERAAVLCDGEGAGLARTDDVGGVGLCVAVAQEYHFQLREVDASILVGIILVDVVELCDVEVLVPLVELQSQGQVEDLPAEVRVGACVGDLFVVAVLGVVEGGCSVDDLVGVVLCRHQVHEEALPCGIALDLIAGAYYGLVSREVEDEAAAQLELVVAVVCPHSHHLLCLCCQSCREEQGSEDGLYGFHNGCIILSDVLTVQVLSPFNFFTFFTKCPPASPCCRRRFRGRTPGSPCREICYRNPEYS